MNQILFATTTHDSAPQDAGFLGPALRSVRDSWEKLGEFLDTPRSATPGIVRHLPDHWLRPTTNRDLLGS
jgi:hypothetical protein